MIQISTSEREKVMDFLPAELEDGLKARGVYRHPLLQEEGIVDENILDPKQVNNI